MGRRVVGPVLAGLAALALTVGCQGPMSFRLSSEGGGTEAPGAKELRGDEAARVCFKLAKDLEKAGHLQEAAGQYEKARNYNPRLEGVARRLAVVYDQLGQMSVAEAEYEKALAQSREPDLLNDAGYHHYGRAQWQVAERLLREALDGDDKHRPAWINLGLTLAQQNRYDEGLTAFEHAVRPAEARCNLAFVMMSQSKSEEAKKMYREALTLEPDLQLARAALARLEGGSTPPPVGQATTAQSGPVSVGRPKSPAPMPYRAVGPALTPASEFGVSSTSGPAL